MWSHQEGCSVGYLYGGRVPCSREVTQRGKKWQCYSPRVRCRPRIGRKGLGTTMVIVAKVGEIDHEERSSEAAVGSSSL